MESRLFDYGLTRTSFEVPGQVLYTSIEKSFVSSNGNRVNWNILEENIITKNVQLTATKVIESK